MEEEKKIIPISFSALSFGTIVAILGIIAMTIGTEISHDFKLLIASLVGHHWLGKGLIALGLFAVFSLFSAPFLRDHEENIKNWSFIVSSVAALGVVVIFLFFLGHYVSTH